MTDDPLADRAALLTLVALGLLVLANCLPGLWPTGGSAPGSAEAAPDEQAADGEELARLGEPRLLLAEGGLVLESFDWRWEEQRGTLFRARVPRTGRAEVRPSAEVRPFGELLPADAGPWAAINGGFYEVGAMGLVVAGGVQHTALSPRGGSGVFLFGPQGARIVHRDRWAPGEPEALQSIDRLVDEGRSLVKARPEAPRAARSAVVLDGEGMALVAAVAAESLREQGEGSWQIRGSSGRGLSLGAFAALLAGSLGAQQALNLDGAISTQLAVRAGDRRFELRGEAGTINALLLRP